MDFDAAQPIYRQIIDDFKKQMIRGELQKGDKIPSQREYAAMASINPNTVQRAYREMESMNLVETLRGQGTFISIDESLLQEIKAEMAKEILNRFVEEMYSLGFSREEVLMMLNENYPGKKEEQA